jgi:hypothetical protein
MMGIHLKPRTRNLGRKEELVSDGARELIDKYIEQYKTIALLRPTDLRKAGKPERGRPHLWLKLTKAVPCHMETSKVLTEKEDHPGHCKTWRIPP